MRFSLHMGITDHPEMLEKPYQAANV